MEESKLKQLKQFVELCKSDPSVLSDPSFSFFRDYIESLGGKLPASASPPKSPNTSESSSPGNAFNKITGTGRFLASLFVFVAYSIFH